MMTIAVLNQKEFVSAENIIEFSAKQGNHRHISLNSIWPRLTKGFNTPFNYEYHVAYSDDMSTVLGVMVVENRHDSKYVCELQSYFSGIGEQLLLSLENSDVEEVFFVKDWSASKTLTFYYNKLARKHNWIHEKNNRTHIYYIKKR